MSKDRPYQLFDNLRDEEYITIARGLRRSVPNPPRTRIGRCKARRPRPLPSRIQESIVTEKTKAW